jgi:glucose-6-phosphate isomerase
MSWWRSLLQERSYGAFCVFGDHGLVEPWNDARRSVESATGRPITVGFGPRFLHSTGQLHKGGPPEGVFLQVIQTPDSSLSIPGRDFDLGTLLVAQAHGDAQVLADAGLAVLSITATSQQLPRLWEALKG